MSLGRRIREHREDLGQDLEDVARGARLHVALVRCIEAGRPATTDQVRALARHFGVQVEELAPS